MDRIDRRKGLPFIGQPAFGWRFAAIGAAVALALPVIALVWLGDAGVATRSPQATTGGPVPSMIATSGPAAVRLMEERGVHGAHLVQASRDFGYRTDALGDALALDLASGDDRELSATSIFRSRMDATNYVYVATRLGLVRRVTHLMSPTALQARIADGRAQGMPGIAKDGKSVTVNQDGDVREIVSTVPKGSDDIVLYVGASYFVDGSIALLVQAVEESGHPVALVVASLDEDVPDLPEGARTELTSFVQNVDEGLFR